ncbi:MULTISPECIES: glycosyltransferase family 4 protein [Parafrankia]|uniref:Alpha-(1-2)-phosphatidylinositol mannosyltransferase n=1 Tax=Parafrankia soli TaxID=2599596 RepID=A0A1S1QRJ9_9ACTN|nr:MULTISPECIES: glycosyltransferase family 4 protein [Parafrankia]OHV37338.1 alpha-(1-2)-phosphatidylinositol mannosyltransferase [Parafrankia soli]TCJ36186.1 glycosyltransferase family 1 protein [Parafrankia sp. BMG5.11]CAI7977901.1 Phosphatidyl-myo-inositol mannosyltransferase [Frankia sp. Hr75.2]SQD97400.1 GDP-mannose-dependent alpha-(1-2)-phosphatidylinositol mannosyltransferase [Parafrankia sp. Ea1.12]
MRIGLACPYTWDVPGGVQAHVRDLAETLLDAGHEVSVITPVDDESTLPAYAVDAGRAVPVPYNGSVARLLMGPVSAARVRRWLREHDFDVLHAHEPTAPSVSLLACMLADGPLVATFHTANPRSRILTAGHRALRPSLEKLRARIAVSEAARRTLVEHLGTGAILIPNGVAVRAFEGARPLPGYGTAPTVAFLGRIDEPRKGLDVLMAAFPRLVEKVPDVRLLVAGPGDTEAVRSRIDPALLGRVDLVGLVPEADKAAVFASGSVYCAPNTGQESFGIVLLEAMAAGTPVVASDIDAFRRVLDNGRAGRLFGVGEPAELAANLAELIEDPAERARLAERGRAVVARYDWRVIAQSIVGVYEMVSGDRPVSVAAPEES